MNDAIATLGLGVAPDVSTPTATNTDVQTSSGGGFFDFIDKFLGVGEKAVDIYNSATGGSNQTTTSNTPPPPAPKSNAGKYILIGGGILAASGITYAVVKASRKKKRG